MMKLQGIRSLTLGIYKVLSTKVEIVMSCSCRCKSLEYLFKACLVFLCLLRKLLGPISWFSSVATFFNCRDLWCSLHRCSCELVIKKAGNCLIFLECIVGKSCDNVNYSGKTIIDYVPSIMAFYTYSKQQRFFNQLYITCLKFTVVDITFIFSCWFLSIQYVHIGWLHWLFLKIVRFRRSQIGKIKSVRWKNVAKISEPVLIMVCA